MQILACKLRYTLGSDRVWYPIRIDHKMDRVIGQCAHSVVETCLTQLSSYLTPRPMPND